MNTAHQSKRLVVLIGSPRRDGNSATLAQAIMAGRRRSRHFRQPAFSRRLPERFPER
ncbi:NAD(P)H-dependent oxidoreductase [Serratia marcescens]|nr:NAD(P)H-dependent oxidoreductase [Serratia marcescens]